MYEAAKNIAKVALTNSPIPELNEVLIECNEDTGEVFLTATNHEVSIQYKLAASVEETGSILFNPQQLANIMQKTDGEFITLTSDKQNTLKITNGRCKYQFICLPSKGYPKPIMPFPEESIIMTGVCSLARKTIFAVSKDEHKPALQCVKLSFKNNAVHAAACDGLKMMLVKESADPTVEREFLLPGYSLQMLASIADDTDVFEVSDIGKEIVFVRGDMIFTIKKMLIGEFIDITKVISNIKPKYSAITEATKIKEALNLMSTAAFMGNIKVPINLVLSNGEIILRCDGDYSQASTTVPGNVIQNTPETGFYYDISALIKLFQVVCGKVKFEIDAKGYMLIKTRTEVYFQIPISKPVRRVDPIKKKVVNKSSQSEQEGEIKKNNSAKGAEDVKEVA